MGIEVAVGCVVWFSQERYTLYYENLSRRQKNILHAAAKAAFGRSLSHLYRGMNQNHVYYGGLASGD